MDDRYVFIGRPGEFGNPFSLEKESDREEVLQKYRDYLEKKISEDIDFRQKVKDLYGKTLVCFCKPKLCHGDFLAEVVERLNKNPNST